VTAITFWSFLGWRAKAPAAGKEKGHVLKPFYRIGFMQSPLR
jgi:hypothetical protein